LELKVNSDCVNRLGYSVECNVDPLHPTLPGTAILWKASLNVSEINQLVERRAQSVKLAGETFINVYAPSGSGNRRERWEFFNDLFTHIIQSGKDKLPVMAGDWNAILELTDTTNNFQSKFCKVLARLIANMNYTDSFRHLHPGAREYTFHRGANIAQSRLDRVYLPPHLVQYLLSAQHKPGISDHCKVEVELDLSPAQVRAHYQQHKKSFWKLNTSLLDNPDFHLQFQVLYEKLVRLIGEYQDHAEWWEVLAKPAIASFCKDMSSKLAKARICTKQFLFSSLKIYLKNENWTEVARVKEELRRMLMY
jgi:exonuclease III